MAKLKTGRHTSALKAHRQSVTRAVVNRAIRSRIRTVAHKLEEAIAAKDASGAKTLLSDVFSGWDKAAKTGVIHWKTAARKKSRLASRVRALSASPANR